MILPSHSVGDDGIQVTGHNSDVGASGVCNCSDYSVELGGGLRQELDFELSSFSLTTAG